MKEIMKIGNCLDLIRLKNSLGMVKIERPSPWIILRVCKVSVCSLTFDSLEEVCSYVSVRV